MKKLSTIKRIAALCSALIIATSCTPYDPLFGNGMIPPSQEMSTLIDSSLSVKTSIFNVDSLPTSGKGANVYLGSIWNEIVGSTNSKIWTTYLPYAFEINDSKYLFGEGAQVDSMKLTLSFSAVKGDTTQKLRVKIYEMADTVLQYYKTYYSNFDGERYYKKTPLLEFDLSGGVQTITKKLPQSFYEKLLINDKDPLTNPYFSDSLFKRMFSGLHIETDAITPPTKGAMYLVNLSLGGLELHYHNKNEKPDTLAAYFYFFDANSRQNVNFYTIQNDHSTSVPALGGVNTSQIGDSTIQLPVTYVQGMAGLGTRVEIDTVYLNDLKQKVVAAGYKNIALHRASIRWFLPDAQPSTYTWAPRRLCLYYNFDKRLAVPDYSPDKEDLQYSSFVSDIGGNINRSNGYYEQTITSTVQRLINEAPGASNVVQLLPSTAESLNYGYVVLGGSTSPTKPPQLVLVYTMVK